MTQKIARNDAGILETRPPKKRLIAYAAHADAHIFGHYSDILSERYEAVVNERGLHECVTAFRKVNRRRNIHFANEVFEFIRRSRPCYVLALDVSDFFGSLNHEHLKTAWASMLQQSRLPPDHFAVFKAITRYCQVERDALFDALHIPVNNPRSRGNHRLPLLDRQGVHSIPDNPNRLCRPNRFREWVRERGLLQINTSDCGIPQGSPISAILANLYMLEMDTALNAFAIAKGGMYRRYCDDILLVMPTPELRYQAQQMTEDWLRDLRLRFNPTKTEQFDFPAEGCITGKPLQYLGFTFDGVHKRIRPGSVARYYRKMRRGVLRAKVQRARADDTASREAPSPLKKKKLYRLYSYLGKRLGRSNEEKRNFLTYAYDAARIMNEPNINKQVKAHWSKLREEIVKPLDDAAPPQQVNRG